MREPLVSVIVPVYNVRTYLNEALDSIVNQTYRNLEIIIVDDGSTDGSAAVCDRYAENDKRVKVIHQSNQGLSGARNTGLDYMTGDVVSFLDSDDAFHPEMLQQMLNVMYATNADIVACRSIAHWTNCKMPIHNIELTPKYLVFNRTNALKAYIDGNIMACAWDKIYKRKCFDTIRYPLGHVYEDIDTTYRIINISECIVLINEPLVMHRKRNDSITREYKAEYAKDRDLAYSKIAEFVDGNTPGIFTEDQRQKVRRTKFNCLLSTYAWLGTNAVAYRDVVLQAAEEVDLKKCDFKTKGKFYLFLYCPQIYTMIFKPLCVIKFQIKKILYVMQAAKKKHSMVIIHEDFLL